MFVRSFVELPASFADLEVELMRAPATWIPGLARNAEEWGTTLLGEVGFEVKVGGVRKEVEIHVGRPVRGAAVTLIPLRWQVTHGEGMFPVMDAELELAALGPHVTQLSMDGRYDPPLGRAGRVADRALMHRVAEATVRDFVQRVGQKLMDALAEHGASPLSRR